MMKALPRLTLTFLFIISQFIVPMGSAAQNPTDTVSELLASMSVEEKVGQLFIVPFVGDDVSAGSDIHILLTEYKVGGVVLQNSNSNFINHAQTPRDITELTNKLQAQTLANKNIPLFIAVDHEGDGYPYTRITGGVTAVPSPMSIGATWNTENAHDIGQIVGQELSAMGINMVLGPVLDVLNSPHPTGRGDMGTRTFGGDPFWVGALGQAYIQGIHQGSNNTIATVAKHFPGHGGSDRLPDNEVATVDKSLQELKRIELPPFFAVTALNDDGTTTDALMSSHIRYRGFQGDIRQFTAPISLDKAGMSALLSLPAFIPWRDAGGLIISDALGVPAVRKHYDPTLQTFPHRRIARDAFLAGNDVLILAQFDLNSVWRQQFENIKDTLDFFASEYRNDSDFAARVDESVTRILSLKFKLFPNAAPTSFIKDGDVALAVSGRGERVINRIAQQSLTLLYPAADEFESRLPQSPNIDDKILVISDSRSVKPCFDADCESFEPLPFDALSNIILRLYGPDTTNQVNPDNIDAITFTELKQVLVGSLAQVGGEENADVVPLRHSAEAVTALIQNADWIIFAALDLNVDRYPDSDALKLFLAQGVNSLYNKKLIVLGLNAPYYLDTTEISKLTAYFGLYSKTEAHLEVAVRALFGEMSPQGASPVSVDGIGYDLASVLSPDLSETFPLKLTSPLPEQLFVPATLSVAVGPILDHNGNLVPDGTPVQFVATYSDGQSVSVPMTNTLQGYATRDIVLHTAGKVRISAISVEAKNKQDVIVTILDDSPTVSPTPSPTPTKLAPTATLAPTKTSPAPSVTSTPSLGVVGGGVESDDLMVTRLFSSTKDFFIALGVILLITAFAFFRPQKSRSLAKRLPPLLHIAVGGLAIYVLMASGWLNPQAWTTNTLSVTAQQGLLILFVLLGSLLAAFLGKIIRRN